MKRMLINATQEEELRMAMVDGQRLYDLNIELPSGERKKANIYKGTITRIEPSLEAAFVSYGADRHGFLPLKEVSSEYFVRNVENGGKVNIKEVLREGQDIVVQIDKEERGNKGAALTTFVSLAGRFIVLKPNKSRSGGVSRRIVGDDRDVARQAMRDVEIPSGMSVIVRTAGIDRTPEELAWDLENLLAVWEAIKKVVVDRPSPMLIYRESNAVVRALRDYLTSEIGEILIDDDAAYEEARQFVEQVMPHNLRKLKMYDDPVPLFTRYQIESQIESAFAHTVHLPSGGSLVIDHTEALVSIDINSARATKGGDIEATALNTNLEAAEEVARQLRLRDLGGLIVIDFIDMGPQKNQREVENRLRESVRQDRARVQIGKISRFGLLEMSRQRLRPSLGESSYLVCPRCSGIGNIRSVESLALAILRIIGEEARKERTAKVIAQLPVEVATYLLNEKRDWVQNLESRHDTQVILVANSALETPHYKIRRVRDDQVELSENIGSSYKLIDSDDDPGLPESLQERKPAEVAAVTTIVPTTPAPVRAPAPVEKAPGFFARLAALFAPGDDDSDEEQDKPRPKTVKKSHKKSDGRGRKRGSKRAEGSKEERQDDGKRRSRGGSKKRGKKSDAADTRKVQNKQADARKDTTEAAPQAANADDSRDEPKKGKKRRSRGGRRRRKSGESAEARDNRVARQSGPNGEGNTDTGDTNDAADTPSRTASGHKPAENANGNERGDADNRRQDGARSGAPTTADAPAREARPKEVTAPAEVARSAAPAAAAVPDAPADNTRPPAPKPQAAPAPKAPRQVSADSGDENTPRAGSGRYGNIGHEDTQPELPVLRQSPPERRAAPAPRAESAPPPAKEPDNAAASRPAAAAPKDGDKREAGDKGKDQGSDKPQGRLLPWEPQPAPPPDQRGAGEDGAQH